VGDEIMICRLGGELADHVPKRLGRR